MNNDSHVLVYQGMKVSDISFSKSDCLSNSKNAVALDTRISCDRALRYRLKVTFKHYDITKSQMSDQM